MLQKFRATLTVPAVTTWPTTALFTSSCIAWSFVTQFETSAWRRLHNVRRRVKCATITELDSYGSNEGKFIKLVWGVLPCSIPSKVCLIIVIVCLVVAVLKHKSQIGIMYGYYYTKYRYQYFGDAWYGWLMALWQTEIWIYLMKLAIGQLWRICVLRPSVRGLLPFSWILRGF